MKYWFIFMGLAILSCEPKIERGRSEEKHNGKVKVLMESVHDPLMEDGEVQPTSGISENTFIRNFYFDRSGKLLKENRFDAKGNLESKLIYHYDAQSNAADITSYHLGRTISGKTVKQFDASGKLIESYDLDEDEKVIRKLVTRVDSAGQKVLTTYQPVKNGFMIMLEQVIGVQEEVLENSYFLHGTLQNKDRNTYDQVGNLIETILFDPFMIEQRITRYKYDDRNNKIETVVLKSGLVTSKVITRYDDRNNIVKVLTYGVLGNLDGHEKRIYDYDLQGNWTRQVVFVNNNPTRVILHKMEYY